MPASAVVLAAAAGPLRAVESFVKTGTLASERQISASRLSKCPPTARELGDVPATPRQPVRRRDVTC